MNDIQFDELIKRLDRNKDGMYDLPRCHYLLTWCRISYKDLVVGRRRYVQRMKAADPKWRTWTEERAPNDVKHKNTFSTKPRDTHYYPPI